MVNSIAGPYQREPVKGIRSRGGFAKAWRGPGRFAVPLPAGVDPSSAGPLFCGGITVFTPLKKHGAGTTAKRVGVVGVGGLGHLAILFGTALGADVTAISRGISKKEDAIKLGAKHYIATGEDLAAACKQNSRSLDLIICTISEYM
jgi:D-arabinose 1-dehydrogenase-like Zn-dependent alcohol dehydrogenase